MLPKEILEQFPELNNHNWKNIGKRRNNSVLNREIYLQAFSEEMIQKITGINHGCHNQLFIDSAVYIDEDEFREFADTIVRKTLENQAYYQELIQKFAESCVKVEDYSQKLINKSFQRKTREELKQDFDEAIKILLPLITFSYLNHNEEEIAKRLLDEIASDHPLKGKLLVPIPKKTLLQQEKEELMIIVDEIENNDFDVKELPTEIQDKIQIHIQKYCWINSHYYHIKEVTVEETIERIKNLLKSKKEEKIQEEVDEVKQLGLNRQQKIILNALREQLFYKTQRKELISLFSWGVKDLFQGIAEKQGITYEEFICQTVDEINTFFEKGVVNKATIKERLPGFEHLYVDGKKIILPKIKSEIEIQQLGDKIITGTSGSPGKVKGKVRIIKNKDELSILREDEILVTDFLSPEMISQITKLKGIITDSGGVLSHAVVLARELRVPCIVGTTKATSVLRTGDIVELDANKGTVQKTLNLPNKKFRKMFGITMPLCRADLYMPTHVFNTAEVIGVGHNEIIFWMEGGKLTGYFSEEAICEVGKQGLMMLKSPKFVEKNVKEVEEEGKKLGQYSEYIAAHQLKYMPTEELLKHYNELFLQIQKMFGYFNVSQPSISYALEKEISQLVQKQGLDGKTQFEILNIMLKPDETTLIEEEEKDLLKLALEIKKERTILEFFLQPLKTVLSNLSYEAEQINKKLLAHQAKYSFLASSENFDEFDLQYYVRRLQEMVKSSESHLHQDLAKKSPDKEVMGKEREELVQKYNLSSELVHFIDITRIYSHQRMFIRLFWTKGINVWGKILRELARRMNLSEVEIQYLTREEINAYFERKTIISAGEIEERKKPCVYAIFNRQKPILFTGEEAKQVYEKYLKEEIEDKTMVKGQIANKGVKVGKVKILAHGENMVKQVYEMEKGDILVTGNTRPDMMLALEKASAVVTDEGGICSHAAIVSRELGIPCVIGTIHATKLFKDGDIIEVNGEEGFAKLVRRDEK